MPRRVSILVLAGLILAISGGAAETPRMTGIYSNLRYVEEAGDLLGHEIIIVPGESEGFYAIVQTAEGAPDRPQVVSVRTVSSKVSFTLADGTAFVGLVSARGLTGTFTYATGATERVFLRRGHSYWE